MKNDNLNNREEFGISKPGESFTEDNDSYSFLKFLFNLYSYPKGRITRLEYFVGILILGVILLLSTFFGLNLLENISFIDTFLIIVLFFSFIIISIKRFNDLNIAWYISIGSRVVV